MEYRKLGRSGVMVSPLCLGTMNFGGSTSEDEACAIMQKAVDAGINFFDTANVYTKGQSESITGRFLKENKLREQIVLATKVFGRVGDLPNEAGGTRYHIVKACEDSLQRLQTDHIDLYQLHRPPLTHPQEETLRAFDDLIRAGKVRYIGCSTHPAWMVMEAISISERYGLNRYVSEQPPYNLLDRRIENELVPLALRYQLALIPWAPLAQGVLAGRYRLGEPPAPDSRAVRMQATIYAERITERGIAVGEKMVALAKQFGKTAGQMALLWCKDQPGVTAPIVGPRTMGHLEDALPVLEMKLSPEEQAACDALVPPGGVVSNFHNTAGWMKTPV